ncbi:MULTISPECIES: GNAT family N-acetyltransferase [Bacillus]|uniref:GNAT family N-acetyltransferase n=1 Tax=Bacillus TaxID=1386 RepID=UPI001913D569|nr:MULTISPECIES: GNAT family N-acetyltransferase [Bacillus]MBK5471638.1 GNAT family N-acetyltransferase [Bacillus sp. TH19]WOA55779.1 GNAT family N-acetyltransferase [Bacillus mycoides]
MIVEKWSYPALYTKRLILRGINMSDILHIYEYASDKEMSTYTVWDAHQSLHDTQKYIEEIVSQYEKEKVAPLGIVLREEQKLIGTCGFIKYDVTEHKAEIAYALSRKYWGRGLATEAASAFSSYGFNELRLNSIEAGCNSENEASEKLMKRLNMEYDCTIQKDLFIKGKYRDTKRYCISRKRYMNQ